MSSRHLYTEHRRGHIQAAPRLRAHRSGPLSRDHPQIPVSMPSLFRFDASAVVHTCSSSHRTPAPLTARRQPQRSPPRLLTDAACGGLESPPARRPRRTYLHHWHSTDRADDLLHHHHFPSGHTWVPKMWSCTLTRHDALASWGPMSRVLYRLLVSLARLAVRSGRSKDLEIIVLRHQLTVLHRQNNRPALADETGPCWVPARRRCPDRSEPVGSSHPPHASSPSKQHGIAQTNGRSLSAATKTANAGFGMGAMVPTVSTGGRERFGVPGELNRQVAVTGAVTRLCPSALTYQFVAIYWVSQNS